MEDGRWVNCLLFGTVVSLLTAGLETLCWKIPSVFFLWFVLPIKGSNGDNATPSLCGRDYFAKSITDLVRRGNCCEGSVGFLLNEHRSWANRSCRFFACPLSAALQCAASFWPPGLVVVAN